MPQDARYPRGRTGRAQLRLPDDAKQPDRREAIGLLVLQIDYPGRLGPPRLAARGGIARRPGAEVPAKSGFDVEASAPAAYLCEFL